MIDLPKKYSLSIKAFLSLFGVGFIPFSPGTIASLVMALFFYFTLSYFSSPMMISLVILALFILYFISLRLIARFLKPPIDKSWIVMDEVIGMTISILPAMILQQKQLILPGFISFRFFDIVKPMSIKYIDSLHTPSSVILDDVLSGIVSAVVLVLLTFVL